MIFEVDVMYSSYKSFVQFSLIIQEEEVLNFTESQSWLSSAHGQTQIKLN